ncbi:MAG: DegV family protein [Clostridia bacterium]|nr:DegV family protein [Clostridia bacterium]
MNYPFIISCESTVDLPYSYVAARDISVLFYSYTMEGKVFEDDMGRNDGAVEAFYQAVKDGKMPTTSQINTYTYLEYFRTLLKDGDVLHIALGSGMTPSVRNAREAAQILKDEFPDRTLIVIDSLGACGGYGMIVDNAADARDKGMSITELEEYILEQVKYQEYQFFSTDLSQFKRSGRVSGVAAAAATILGICPIMHLDATGHIIAYGKVRGKKNAIAETVRTMADRAKGGVKYSGKCFINHSGCLEDALETEKLIRKTFPNLRDVRILDIGTIIGSHTGVGTVAVFYTGEKEKAVEKE